MPHLVIEYSPGSGMDALIAELCKALHEVMVGSDVFPTAGIRVRAHQAEVAIVADGLPENDFVAMTLNVGAGRTEAVLHEAGQALFTRGQKVLHARLAAPHFAFSLDIRVSDPALSWKDTPIHARLSGKT